MPNNQAPTALVIQHKISRGSENLYEEWAATIEEQVKKSPGYVGIQIFPPVTDGDPYNIIIRFETQKDVQTWLDSPERKESVEKIRGVLEEGDKREIRAGMDVWFPPTGTASRPRAYKEFLLTAVAVYPLTVIIPMLVLPLLKSSTVLENPLVENLVITVILVALLNFLIMPTLTRWLKNWLYDANGAAES